MDLKQQPKNIILKKRVAFERKRNTELYSDVGINFFLRAP